MSETAAEKKALIFGISGFVGPYLAREFYSNGYSVFGTDLARRDTVPEFVGFSVCDILDGETVAKLIAKVKPTHIINLAALSSVGLSWKFPQKAININVVGTLNIIEAMRQCADPPKLLLIGSSEEYEISDGPITEGTLIEANNPYGISKEMQEKLARIYHERYGLDIYYVRAFNHIGVGQAESFVIPSWCKQVAEISKSDDSGTIKVGNLDVLRDFSDVRDIVRAYRLILESNNCEEIFNVGSGEAVSLKEILGFIVSLSPQGITIDIDRDLFRPADNPVICSDITKIKNRLGWEPEHELWQSIGEIYHYYEKDSERV